MAAGEAAEDPWNGVTESEHGTRMEGIGNGERPWGHELRGRRHDAPVRAGMAAGARWWFGRARDLEVDRAPPCGHLHYSFKE
jgi:hypothetical protein